MTEATLATQAVDAAGPLIRRMVGSANIEVIPMKGAEEAVAALPSTTTVTITCSPKFGLERTLQHAEAAVRSGHRVIPHIAARQVDSAITLTDYLTRIQALGIDDLYVIGGDVADPAGPYPDAEHLLDAIVRSEHRPRRLGVGCYPEGHPKIDEGRLHEALLRKQQLADYMVSQLCFDPEAIATWLRGARADGVRLPLRIGLAAPLKTSKLIELSLRIGVGDSVRFLSKQRGMLTNLVLGRSYQPEELVYALAEDISDPAAGIEGLHLFSFNQVAATAAWQQWNQGLVQTTGGAT